MKIKNLKFFDRRKGHRTEASKSFLVEYEDNVLLKFKNKGLILSYNGDIAYTVKLRSRYKHTRPKSIGPRRVSKDGKLYYNE